MATIALFIEDNTERQVLQILLESYGYSVVVLAVSNSSFMEVVQYNPQHIIFEIPEDSALHLSLINRIRTSNKTSRIPVIGYGDQSDRKVIFEIKKMGVTTFLERPLTTNTIQSLIKPKKGKQLTLHDKEMKIYEGELEDTARIMSPATSAPERIEIMVKRIGELLAFPFTVAKVLSVTQSDTTGAKDLAKAIELDPVVVSSVLKVANSALYRGTSSTLGIKDAIVRLGFIETKNIAISMSIMKLFSDEEKSVGFSREDFWFHSLATAIMAGELAKRIHYPKPEIAFICGLLHDFGIILLDEFFPSYLNLTLKETTQRGDSFIKVQRDKWGITHNDVVARLFREWNMPDEVIEVMRNLYRYVNYENKVDESVTTLVQIVGMSETMAKGLSLGRECDEYVTLIPNYIIENMKIINQINDRFFVKISEELNMFCSYLNLDKQEVQFKRVENREEILHYITLVERSRQLLNPFMYSLVSQKNFLMLAESVESILESDQGTELIVLFPSIDDELDEIRGFFTIPKKEIERESDDDEEEFEEGFVPVIVIADQTLWDDSVEIPDHVVLLNHEMDLRILSFAIESLCLGHPFNLETHVSGESENQHDTEKTEEKEKTVVPFSVKTKVVHNAVAVLELYGNAHVKHIRELSPVVAALLKKTKYIGIDFTNVETVNSEFLVILDNFRKVIRQKGGILCLYAMKEGMRGELSEADRQIVFVFKSEQELLLCIKQSIAEKTE